MLFCHNNIYNKNYNSLFFLSLIIILSILFLPVLGQETSNTTSSLNESVPVYIAEFFEPGCHDCEKAARYLEQISFQYPEIEIREFDISTPEGVTLAEQIGEIYGISENDRLLVPLIYINDNFLLRDQISYDNIIELVEESKEKAALPPWERVNEDIESVQQRLIERFQSFGIGAIAISGLIDGINPCAFATIIFFISYLALIKRTGKELLMVGSMFTLAIFLTYFLIGAGALKAVTTLSFLPLARQIFIFVTAGIGLILGTMSLIDYLRYKKTGQTSDATLQLPPRIKQMIHSTIRKNVKTRNFVLMAAVTGFMVSILELACTGQVYLPTIIFISNVPEFRANALVYLFLYNLMFVVPLILVFLFTYWGTSSQKWAELNKKHFGAVKLIMTILFFGLALLLITTGLIF